MLESAQWQKLTVLVLQNSAITTILWEPAEAMYVTVYFKMDCCCL